MVIQKCRGREKKTTCHCQSRRERRNMVVKVDVSNGRAGSSHTREPGRDKRWAVQRNEGQEMLPVAKATESKTHPPLGSWC